MTRPRVWGWASPWSGDENDPVPASYRWWYRLYVANQRFWHFLRVCDWHRVHPDGDSQLHYRCDWCGRITR